jgi:hypothetical protein
MCLPTKSVHIIKLIVDVNSKKHVWCEVKGFWLMGQRNK